MQETSRSGRRMTVILNYLSVVVLAIVVDMRASLGWGNVPVLLTALGALVLGCISFVRVFWRTGLWKFTHSGFKRLDERQVQVVYEALRNSYWIFAVICLGILYVNAVLERGHIPVVVAGSILYLAHTLPAAVVAWTEKETLSN